MRRPVLVAAFRGWNDGGQAATLAAGYLARAWSAARFADIDPEEFFDFQVTRPHVSLVEGVTRKVDWPDNAFFHAGIPTLSRDAVLMLGIEPNIRWRTFTSLIVDLAHAVDVELVITLGSLVADVPHTREAPVTGSASDATLIEQYGLEGSRYEGPTGIVGVLHDAFKAAEIPSLSLWAAVPHYVSHAPSPLAALALCRRLGTILGTPIQTAELDTAAEAYRAQVSEAVASDSETVAYVEELERRADELEAQADLPSGDALAAELTRFLKEREDGEGSPDGPSAQ